VGCLPISFDLLLSADSEKPFNRLRQFSKGRQTSESPIPRHYRKTLIKCLRPPSWLIVMNIESSERRNEGSAGGIHRDDLRLQARTIALLT
jgi:hypothetical protein